MVIETKTENLVDKIDFASYQEKVNAIDKMIVEKSGAEVTSLAGLITQSTMTRMNWRPSSKRPSSSERTMTSWSSAASADRI